MYNKLVRQNLFKKVAFFSIAGIILLFIIIPTPQFKAPYSTVLEDREGNLLGALIAEDGQWRFPASDSIPKKVEQAIITFEDKNFYHHPGIDPFAMGRAAFQNIRKRRIVSGGSTITMQLVRLSRKGRARNFFEKTIESIYAIKTDIAWSKTEILKQYVSHAPFGGNVVGISAASWRYFGRDASKLSWAESALLAVLPNHPSMIHPGRNRTLLQKKRDRLLDKLFRKGIIDKTTYELSLQEELPIAPQPLPRLTPHLLHHAVSDGKKGQVIITSINLHLQQRVQEIVSRYHSFLKANSIHNGAALVLDIENNEVLAYVGNTIDEHSEHDNDVDIVTSQKSYGSLLKPVLYASMLEEGAIAPHMLIPDIPTNIAGYAPQNFSKSYEGAASAANVLSHSLNVPSVRMLQNFGTEKFLFNLKALGMDHLNRPADHYGLSIILGGAESSLWELTSLYGNMARQLAGLNPSGKFHYDIKDTTTQQQNTGNYKFSKPSVWHTFEALSESKRPGANGNWEVFHSSQKIAWKTGTSYGFRDAWSIGITQKYVVGIWFGNANGEGRAGLTGIGTAAPAMFEIFNLLNYTPWFDEPTAEMVKVKMCAKSGHKATSLCEETVDMYIPKPCLKTLPCPYHIRVNVDKSGAYRVTSNCEKVANIQMVSRFVLPPVQEWYYKAKDPSYKPLPPFRPDCHNLSDQVRNMEFIYPRRAAKIYIPRELTGKMSKVVFEAAHRRAETTIFWHLDGEYIGQTGKFHQIECFPPEGKHMLTIIDEQGEVEQQYFEVMVRK